MRLRGSRHRGRRNVWDSGSPAPSRWPGPSFIPPRRSPAMRSRPTGFRSTRRRWSSSRRRSGRSWPTRARDATGRRSRRAACGSTRGRAVLAGGQRPGRRSCRASPRRACWSTRSTTATTSRCRRSRSCPTARSPRLTRWVEMGAPWPRRPARDRRQAGADGPSDLARAVAALVASSRSATSRPARRDPGALAPEPDRPLHPRRAGGEGTRAGRRGRPPDADPPR